MDIGGDITTQSGFLAAGITAIAWIIVEIVRARQRKATAPPEGEIVDGRQVEEIVRRYVAEHAMNCPNATKTAQQYQQVLTELAQIRESVGKLWEFLAGKK